MSYDLIENNDQQRQIANPFGNVVRDSSGGVAGIQAASHEIAEMQAQIYLAKQFPRNQIQATDAILTACQRPGLAAAALYSYSRGGTDISGPSIRLAEEIARNWGNVECGWNELERSEHNSKVRAYAWDKQTNIMKVLIFVVPLYRTSNDKKTRMERRTKLTSERDVYEHLANHAARRMRNCILALIPGDVVEAAVAQCQKTLVATCEITPESIKKLTESFKKFGVTKEMIEKRIQRRIDSIAPAQFVNMRTIYASLQDEMSEISDWFEIEEPAPKESQAERLEKELAARSKKKTNAPPSKQPRQTEQPADRDETPEPTRNRQGDLIPSAFDDYVAKIEQTTTLEGFKTLAREIQQAVVDSVIVDEEYATLKDLAETRAGSLGLI